ncbi:hypothetical protein PR202_gb12193 [Eleusine coracana subsp. coracana]|uniref:Uncharacterized protein n=1 Tax=Eleusine coracana subsp. coracana TaxID=191504 RepID=A0AAV5EPM4_ELECO|nr:hypothetical protein PR202_gb12193 [Eleusine coracana subsp. coracana]
MNSTSEVMKPVVSLSYNNLIEYLKTCVLYLHMYPEGCTVSKDDLVKQWLAEGFIDAPESCDMEQIAASYFYELIDRNFIQPACVKHDEVLSCRIHDLCMPSIGKFKLLRVMNLQLFDHNDKDTFDLTGISELFHLRYLKVAGDVSIQLPEQMRGLKYLETLDISAKVTAIPWDIIHLPCLLHLHLPLDQNMLAWISNMRFANEWSLGKLTSNLWNLRVTCGTQPREHLERNMEALSSVLGGFSKLKTLALVPGPSQEKTRICFPSESEVLLAWDGFTSPVLQRFEWSLNSCIFFSVPKWTAKLGSLRVLKIAVQELLRDSIDILKRLPVLTDLSLYWQAATLEMIVFDKVGFSSLEYFKISTDDGASGSSVTQEQNSRDDLKEDVEEEMSSQLLVEKGFASFFGTKANVVKWFYRQGCYTYDIAIACFTYLFRPSR